MNYTSSFFRLGAGILMGSSLASLQAQQAIPVTPSRALQVSILGVSGNTYRLYSSVDLTNWSPVANVREFGTGAYLSSVQPAPEDGKFFRYLVDAQPNGGLAPWSVTGQEWEANSGGNFTAYRFLSQTNATVQEPGQTSPVPVSYQATRTGENALKLTIQFSPTRTRLINCEYFTATTGLISWQDVTDGVVVDSTIAVFQPIPPPSELLRTAPSGLNGRAILLHEPTGTILAAFPEGKKAPTLKASIPLQLAEGYAAQGDTATFTIRDNQRVDFYHLVFKSPRGGTFFRKRSTSDLPSASHNGTFLITQGS